MTYLLDANTFIEAKNRYYHMQICPAYWDWIDLQVGEGQIASIDFIQRELLDGKDQLSDWVKDRNHLFLATSDEETQAQFGKVAEGVMSLDHMKDGAREEFLDCADPWLVAKAATEPETVVVTHETYDPNIRKKIKLPNICRDFEVPYINTFELLRILEAEFVLAQS